MRITSNFLFETFLSRFLNSLDQSFLRKLCETEMSRRNVFPYSLPSHKNKPDLSTHLPPYWHVKVPWERSAPAMKPRKEFTTPLDRNRRLGNSNKANRALRAQPPHINFVVVALSRNLDIKRQRWEARPPALWLDKPNWSAIGSSISWKLVSIGLS